MPNFVSTDLLQAARRSAKRKRAASACISCKEKKTKCSGFSPCTRCTNAAECTFGSSPNKPAVIIAVGSPAYPKDLNFIETFDSGSGIGHNLYPQCRLQMNRVSDDERMAQLPTSETTPYASSPSRSELALFMQINPATSSDATALHIAAKSQMEFAADVQSARLRRVQSQNGQGCVQRDSDAIYSFSAMSVGDDGRCDGPADCWICPPLAWLGGGSDNCP